MGVGLLGELVAALRSVGDEIRDSEAGRHGEHRRREEPEDQLLE
jgi:hypothetical protein